VASAPSPPARAAAAAGRQAAAGSQAAAGAPAAAAPCRARCTKSPARPGWRCAPCQRGAARRRSRRNQSRSAAAAARPRRTRPGWARRQTRASAPAGCCCRRHGCQARCARACWGAAAPGPAAAAAGGDAAPHPAWSCCCPRCARGSARRQQRGRVGSCADGGASSSCRRRHRGQAPAQAPSAGATGCAPCRSARPPPARGRGSCRRCSPPARQSRSACPLQCCPSQTLAAYRVPAPLAALAIGGLLAWCGEGGPPDCARVRWSSIRSSAWSLRRRRGGGRVRQRNACGARAGACLRGARHAARPRIRVARRTAGLRGCQPAAVEPPGRCSCSLRRAVPPPRLPGGCYRRVPSRSLPAGARAGRRRWRGGRRGLPRKHARLRTPSRRPACAGGRFCPRGAARCICGPGAPAGRRGRRAALRAPARKWRPGCSGTHRCVRAGGRPWDVWPGAAGWRALECAVAFKLFRSTTAAGGMGLCYARRGAQGTKNISPSAGFARRTGAGFQRMPCVRA
jgi:hypothetical protein